MSEPLALLILGALIGVLSGLLGVGGGLMMIPALMYGLPLMGFAALGVKAATAASAMQAVASGVSSSWAHARRKTVLWGVALPLGAAALGGGYWGGLLSGQLDDRFLKYLLVAVIAIVMTMFGRNKAHHGEQTPLVLSVGDALRLPELPRAALLAVGVGVLSGVLGIGGSLFLIPIMTILLRLPMRNAIGAGSATVLMISAAALLGKWQADILPLREAMLLTVGAFFGGMAGARLTSRVSPIVLKRLMMALMGLALARTLTELLLGI
ncbi:MAG: sulfite exporter TauE/SafE family protein [Vampirovibrionales bacterium]|nr:sulfite exporter TauE/SafE family protein [Vampirovibrionales bacterium]